MRRSLKVTCAVAACLVAGLLGHSLAALGQVGINPNPPNQLTCDTDNPRNCYCHTFTRSDDEGNIYYESCYGTSADAFYTCKGGGPNDDCDATFDSLKCGDNPAGKLYAGACNATGGPTQGAQSTGTCVYAEDSCDFAF
jgi:hypothetical protein